MRRDYRREGYGDNAPVTGRARATFAIVQPISSEEVPMRRQDPFGGLPCDGRGGSGSVGYLKEGKNAVRWTRLSCRILGMIDDQRPWEPAPW